eukprot:CAMPEP_0173407136 /NCGR_PEP_ID=MMETSP1356-20130122/66387_1 /TAXON_ID=77927 ORGANISM="Hemiselmis virescens, Strain PCC157" /NCGR_SAMPLE_ID=MMETSP1356 /ASSEMBLY_ACC=CAM_ASM_000847 /LENGTH=57 /DNA_ID=CAMNT_0014368249 /DNA_START=144 /DNA_END=314 /DNA_ORIENTATION=-
MAVLQQQLSAIALNRLQVACPAEGALDRSHHAARALHSDAPQARGPHVTHDDSRSGV